MHFIYSHKYSINLTEDSSDNVRAQRYSRKVSTGTENRALDLLLNVRALYQPSYPDRTQSSYVISG